MRSRRSTGSGSSCCQSILSTSTLDIPDVGELVVWIRNRLTWLIPINIATVRCLGGPRITIDGLAMRATGASASLRTCGLLSEEEGRGVITSEDDHVQNQQVMTLRDIDDYNLKSATRAPG